MRLRPDLNKNFRLEPLIFFVTDLRQKFNDIILFGVTKNENSVQLKVNEWNNFFCIKVPTELSIDEVIRSIYDLSQYHCKILNVEKCIGSDLIGYTDEKFNYLRIYYSSKSRQGIDDLKSRLTELQIRNMGVYNFSPFYDISSPEKQFLIDTNINSGSWLRIEPNHINYINIIEGRIKAEANIENITKIDCDEIPALYVLSFDIECKGGRFDENGKSIFPEPEHDPVITIGNYIYKLGNPKPVLERGFQLGSIEWKGDEDKMLSFDDEKTLLEEWFQFVRIVDPDIIESFNGTNFDLPYIVNRAKHFSLAPDFGRDDQVARCYQKKGATIKTAARVEWGVQIFGRINWDVYKICFSNEKFSRYTLNFIAQTLIGDQKIDLNYTTLNEYQDTGPAERRVILDYCMKDSELPHAISLKQMYFIRYIELARVSMTPIEWLIHRGQAIKCSIQIRNIAKLENKFVKDTIREKSDEQYEGAIVLEPRRGLYSSGPVTCCDFNSLYPNIARRHNLCYTTYIPKNTISNYDPSIYHETPNGEYFVNKEVKEGLICKLLTNLLNARSKAKIDMKNAETKEIEDIMNARQLGLKLCANSGMLLYS